MSMQHGIAALIWLLGAATAFGVSALWLVDAHAGKMSAWALVSLAWSAALIAVLAHHVAQFIAPRASAFMNLRGHEPLAAEMRHAEDMGS
jgi:hypothetical protein